MFVAEVHLPVMHVDKRLHGYSFNERNYIIIIIICNYFIYNLYLLLFIFLAYRANGCACDTSHRLLFVCYVGIMAKWYVVGDRRWYR